MRITSLSVIAVTFLASLSADTGDAKAALWKGAPTAAKHLMKNARIIPEGTYTLENGNGKFATFFSRGDDVQMWPKGRGHSDLGARAMSFVIRQHPIRIKGYRALHSIHIFNKSGNEKCLTASWGSTADIFGVFDMCRVDLLGNGNHGGKTHISSAHGNLPNDKQLWILVPASGRNRYHIVAAAHIQDMLTRCLYGIHIQGRGAMGYYKGLQLNDCTKGDKTGFHWTIKKVGGL